MTLLSFFVGACWTALAFLLLPAGVFLFLRGERGGPFVLGRGAFRAVCVAIAGTVGVGNIVGVAVALTLGGPGALFWMWVSALSGMGTKYRELRLSARNRAYLPRALWRPFALLTVLFSLGSGNLVQVGSLAGAAREPLLLGLLFAGAFLVLGKRRGRFLTLLVPAMAALYLGGCCFAIWVHRAALPAAFSAILRGIVEPRALLWGVRRGCLSHEAGLGTGALAHGHTENSPHAEGVLGAFEVAFDTLVVGSATGFLLLTSGAAATGVDWARTALAVTFGELARPFFALCLVLFSFSSVLSAAEYGELSLRRLDAGQAVGGYRTLFALLLMAAPLLPFRPVLDCSDFLTACMLTVHLAGLLHIVSRETNAVRNP